MEKKIIVFESASLGVATVQLRKLDQSLNEIAVSYSLVMDFNAIAKAEQETGKDLSSPSNWANLTGYEVCKVCWCAFERFHPEVTLKEVLQMLAPAQSGAVMDLLFEMCFPGLIAKSIEARKKKEAEGESQPNPPQPAGAIS